MPDTTRFTLLTDTGQPESLNALFSGLLQSFARDFPGQTIVSVQQSICLSPQGNEVVLSILITSTVN